MVIFGIKEKIIKKSLLSNVTCSECKEHVSMTYIIESKYFHLYWIPILPYKKVTHVFCNECDSVFKKKQFSENIKVKLQRENELNPARHKVWMFSGLIVLAILIPWAFLQSANADERKGNYINNPKVGDVYFLNCIPSKYTTMKIAAVEKDSVYFILNDTAVSRFKKVFFITDDRYYSDKIKSYSKKELVDLYRKDSIYTIDRD